METKEIKEELQTSSEEDQERLICRTCLCSNKYRKLYLLPNSRRIIYLKMCEVDEAVIDYSSEIHLCWECVTLLRKFIIFKEKTQKSRQLLTYNYYIKNNSTSLSSLTFSETHTTDYLGDNLNKEFEIAFKTEPDYKDSELFDNVYDDNNVCDNFEINFDDDFDTGQIDDKKDLNLEPPLKIKKEPKEKKIKKIKRHYKIVSSVNKKKVVKRMAIPVGEIDFWREKERKSKYFVELLNKCDLCLCALKKSETLVQHYKEFHIVTKNLPYTCDICKMALNAETRKKHISSHYLFYQCEACGYQCYTYSHMLAHVREHNVVKCRICEAVFSDVRTCQYHYRLLHSKAVCDYCGKECSTKTILERHIKRRHTIHHCKPCNKTYKTIFKYNDHVKLKHTIDRSEASFCVLCNIQFDNRSLYRQHLQHAVAHLRERGEPPIKGSFKCPECPNTYTKRTNMLDHYKFVHCNSQKHLCEECNKSFLTASVLKRHKKSYHEGFTPEKNKLCSICGRGFSTKRILENHIRTHTGERPFQCHLCDARFTQKTARQTHIKLIHYKNKRLST